MLHLEKLVYGSLLVLLIAIWAGIYINADVIIEKISGKVAESYQPFFDEIEAAQKEYEEELNSCVENNYTVYLDGEEVDIHKLDLSLYSLSINHEEQVIYATKNESRSDGSSHIPILWPLFFR